MKGLIPHSMQYRLAMLALCALAVIMTGVEANAQSSPPATATPPATLTVPLPDVKASGEYDVIANVLSDPQRKMLDRDSRCHDARSATDAFVASEGKALQTGVDAMAALEKCAGLTRVGEDWSDFRDYVITAAAALAYKVGDTASDERLLRRAVDDAANVKGYEASNATVKSLSKTFNAREDTPDTEARGHGMGDGPPQADRRYVAESKLVPAYSGAFGKQATEIARASNTRLQQLASAPNARPQEHATPTSPH